MKKTFLLFSLILGFVFTVNAQLEVTPMGGYFWGGKVKFYEGEINMHDGGNFGIIAGAPTMKGNFVELSYSFTGSTAEFRPYSSFSGYDRVTADLNTHYILLGTYQQIETGGKVVPFIGINLGATIFDYDYPNSTNLWRFAMGIGGGIKYYISDKIGIRIQGRFLMPMYFAGMGFYAGIGTGGASTGLSMNAGAIAYQGDVSGGLIFRLK